MKKFVECKSLGIPLREDVAREVDALMKKLPKEYRKLQHKGSADAPEVVKGECSDISMVSVESVDREGDVILAKGMDTTNFSKNPVVTWAHNYGELPVGMAGATSKGVGWVKKVAGGIRAKTIYALDNPMGETCWKMVQGGFLRGKSIGFLASNVRSPTKEEMSKHPEWKGCTAVIDQAMLLEYAVCTIPVNQDALVEAVAKGKIDKATLKRMGFKIPERQQSQADQVAALVKAINNINITPDDIIRRLTAKYRA